MVCSCRQSKFRCLSHVALACISGIFYWRVFRRWLKHEQRTGNSQVQTERSSMSWIERILNKSNITQTRKASIPEGYGQNVIAAVRYFIVLNWSVIWKCVLSVITICVCQPVHGCICCWMQAVKLNWVANWSRRTS